MQRIALSLLLGALALAGCTHPTRELRVQSPPQPLPPPPIAQYRPAPLPPPRLDPPPPREFHTETVAVADLQVPGGIQFGQWHFIVVHHSATPTASPESMHRYHRDRLGWNRGLGYHFVIGNGVAYPDGQLFVGPRWHQQCTGAHCKTGAGIFAGGWHPANYFNDHGIGICLIGDLDRYPPTTRQLRTLHDLIAVLSHELGISPANVYGHGEISGRTACPGRRLNLPTVRQAVAALLADDTPVTYARDAEPPAAATYPN